MAKALLLVSEPWPSHVWLPDCKKWAKAPKAEGASQKQVGEGGGQGEGQGQNPVSACAAGTADPSQVKGQGVPYLNPDPFQWWIGPKNLGEAVIDGKLTTCLLDNGAQLNFITPAYARQRNMNVFPLECLAKEVGDAIPPIQGIGGIMVQPTGFVIVRVQIPCVARYDEDQVTIVLDDPGMKEYPHNFWWWRWLRRVKSPPWPRHGVLLGYPG